MANIWVISDTHFYHDNIIEYTNRPFKDAMTMNLAIRDNWNSVVAPEDKVYHLGDVYMGARGRSREEIEAFLKSLNGKKRLILGNHDAGHDHVIQRVFEKIYLIRWFKEYGIVLSHIPMHIDSIKKDYVNVHGHIHEKLSPKGPYRNVSVEWTNYRPIEITEILK